MSCQFVQKLMTLNDQNAYTITRTNNKVSKANKSRTLLPLSITCYHLSFIFSSNLWRKLILYALLTRQSRHAYCFSLMCIWPYKDRIGVPYRVVCAFAVCVEADRNMWQTYLNVRLKSSSLGTQRQAHISSTDLLVPNEIKNSPK